MPNGMKDSSSSSQGISPSSVHANALASQTTRQIWSGVSTNGRDAPGSRGSDDASAPFGSKPSTSDNTPWAPSNLWTPTTTESAAAVRRPSSGTASPTRTRDVTSAMPITNSSSANGVIGTIANSSSANGVIGSARNGLSSMDNDDPGSLSSTPFSSAFAPNGLSFGSTAQAHSRDNSLPSSQLSQNSASRQDALLMHDRHHRPQLSSSAFGSSNSLAYNLNANMSASSAVDLMPEKFLSLSLESNSGPSNVPSIGGGSYLGSSQLWRSEGVADYSPDSHSSQLPTGSRPAPPSIPTGPRSYNDVWAPSRPSSSRDPSSLGYDLDRRALGAYSPLDRYQQPAGSSYTPYSQHPTSLGPQFQNGLDGGPGSFGQMHMSPFHPGRPRDQDPPRHTPSPILEAFKASHKSSARWNLPDIYGHIVEFSGDQHGSRFIQSKLETANSDEKDHVFTEIGRNIVPLMKDIFGNYVIQKLYTHGNQVQKRILADHIRGKMVDLSEHTYACRVVQKALEHILVEQQIELADELEHHVLRLINDQNGNHVIQKVITLVPRNHIDFIMDSVRGQAAHLSMSQLGCRVIQRLLDWGSPDDKKELLTELMPVAQHLIEDQYGNYVAQHIIAQGPSPERSHFTSLVVKHLAAFSKQKYASNVVESCISKGSQEERNAILDVLFTDPVYPTGTLYSMMTDQFGNYVIQKVYKRLQGQQRVDFLNILTPLISLAKRSNPPKQIAALEKTILESPVLNGQSDERPLSNGNSSLHLGSVAV